MLCSRRTAVVDDLCVIYTRARLKYHYGLRRGKSDKSDCIIGNCMAAIYAANDISAEYKVQYMYSIDDRETLDYTSEGSGQKSSRLAQ